MKIRSIVLALVVASCVNPASPPTVAPTVAPTATPSSPSPSASPVDEWGPFPVMGIQNRADPNPFATPGVNNPAVTQATISTTICVSGYTSTIRPPVSYTGPLKIKQIGEYQYTDTALTSYEEDHLIALEDGGDPRDPRNLWPEPAISHLNDGTDVGFHVKDGFENWVHSQICSGAITLDAGRHMLADDWVGAWLASGKQHA